MIRVSVLYSRKEGARFDWIYYFSSHMPLVDRKLGTALKGVSVEQGLAGGIPGSPPAFVAMAHLSFDSVEAFQAAFGPHAAEITGSRDVDWGDLIRHRIDGFGTRLIPLERKQSAAGPFKRLESGGTKYEEKTQ